MEKIPYDEARAEILGVNAEQNRSMVEADTQQLEKLLADDFVLVHITGLRQPKADWLEEIRAGSMDYHEIREQSVTVTVDGATAVLVARSLVTATIWGSEAVWPLQMATTFRREDDGWKPVVSRATTF
jgi:hypothetical protein